MQYSFFTRGAISAICNMAKVNLGITAGEETIVCAGVARIVELKWQHNSLECLIKNWVFEFQFWITYTYLAALFFGRIVSPPGNCV